MPKEDGTFEVGVYPYDRFAQDMAVATVNVVGDVITGNQDMHFPVVQLYGQVFEKTGTPITNYQYSVEIVDDNGNHVKQANGFDNNGLAFYYRLSQLPEGNYGLILHPGEHYRSLGYIASSPVPFTVNSDGVATAETKDLMFREASAQPAELRYNHVETVPSNWGTLDVNFELMYAGATQFSDISCELIRMGPGTEGSPDVIIDQIPLDTIWNNEHGFE